MTKAVIIILLLCTLPGFSQVDKYECVQRNNYSAEQRLRRYPFNVAKSVVIASFNNSVMRLLKKDTPLSVFKEKIWLKSLDVELLTHLLYNLSIKGDTILIRNPKCYEPRNAILFLNRNGEILEFIEICFSCYQTRPSSDKVSEGDWCSGKINMLRTFFIERNIIHGTMND